MKKIFFLAVTVLLSSASTSFSEIDRNCPAPDWDLFVSTDGQMPTIVNSVKDHNFVGGENIFIRINGAFTGSYYFVWYNQAQELELSKEYLYLDGQRSYSLPCGYSITKSCRGVNLDESKGGRKWDAITVIYTPCFSEGAPDEETFLSIVGRAGFSEIPRCSQSMSASYRVSDVDFVPEYKIQHGCSTVESRNGLKSVLRTLPIKFSN